MKNKIILLIVIGVVLLISIVVLCIIFGPKKVKISEIKSIHFSYSNGYSAYAYTMYDLDYKDGKYIASIKPDGIPENEAREINVDEEFVKKIENILSKYNVGSWDGFRESDKYVLDGDSFSLSVHFVDKTDISASGYMRWPKNYSNVREELDNLFMGLYNKTF
jgi:hypothetical protein